MCEAKGELTTGLAVIKMLLRKILSSLLSHLLRQAHFFWCNSKVCTLLSVLDATVPPFPSALSLRLNLPDKQGCQSFFCMSDRDMKHQRQFIVPFIFNSLGCIANFPRDDLRAFRFPIFFGFSAFPPGSKRRFHEV